MPVEIGLANMVGGDVDSASAWRSFIDPGAEVFPGTGINNLLVLEGAPTLLSLWPQIRNILQGKILVAHGAGTERRFLLAFPGHGFGPWVDTLRLCRAVYPTLPSHSLGDACISLGLVPEIEQTGIPGNWHEALYDAVACLVLLRHLMKAANLSEENIPLLQKPDLSSYLAERKKTLKPQ